MRNQPVATRRRLVKGAVGALPAVLTLASGSQAAAASISCSNFTGSAGAPQRFTSGGDGWYRQPVVTGTVTGSTHEKAFCVENSPVPAAADGTYYDACAANGSVTRSVAWVNESGTPITAQVNAQSKDEFLFGSDRRYGLIYVDSTGKVKSLKQGASTPYAVTTAWVFSCA